jgi:mannonate dehydratase
MTIRDVRTILTAPAGICLVVVKVETDEPELFGLGCATFTQRPTAVKAAVDEYLKPFLVGKDPSRIEDIFQTAMVSAYWRNGPVLNNALSGVDMALWDIKGKLAGMPVYHLFGGACREAAMIYRHADGRELSQVADRVRAFVDQGVQVVRVQFGGYGGKQVRKRPPDGAAAGAYYDPEAYSRSVVELFEYLRVDAGVEVELLHDVHERLEPIGAVRLAKQLEPYNLFFLEDPLPPEHIEWFEHLRAQCATPIAMGELFNHPREWTPLVSGKLIDFIRVHVSQIGGLTPARKLTAFCEAFGVRTAWHGPGDVSPVGHAANLHLDLASPNFGIQELSGFTPVLQDVFPGCPEVREGYLYPNDRPGLGIDIDEEKAARFGCPSGLPSWTCARRPDGTSARP